MTTKIGLIWPGGGSEQEYYKFEESLNFNIRFYLACSKVGGNSESDHDLSALLQTAKIEWIAEAAERILCMDPHCIYWACTSGSFIKGKNFAEEQILKLNEITKKPVGSTSIAFIKALDYLKIRDISVIASYPENILKKFTSFLEEFNLNIVSQWYLNAKSGWDASNLDKKLIENQIINMNYDKSKAILIPDTAMPTLEHIKIFENLTNKFILTANQVSIWDSINISNNRYIQKKKNINLNKYGKLFLS